MTNGNGYLNDTALLGAGKYVAAVVETTGGDPEKDGLIMLSAVRVVRGRITGKFKSLADPGKAIDPAVSRRIGVSEDMLFNAPPTDDMLAAFTSFLAGDIIVGDGIEAKLAFLNAKLNAKGVGCLNNPCVDLDKLNKALFPEIEDHSFAELASSLLGGTRSEYAAASKVPETVAKCYEALKKYCEDNGMILEKPSEHTARGAAAELVQSIRAAEKEQAFSTDADDRGGAERAAEETPADEAAAKEGAKAEDQPPAAPENRSAARLLLDIAPMLASGIVTFLLLLLTNNKPVALAVSLAVIAIGGFVFHKFIRKQR